MTVPTPLRVLRETALWCGALAGLVAVAAGVAVVLFHASFLVFRSGSMAPAIDTGSLAVAMPVDAHEIRVGDVVTVRASDGSVITHRVESTTLHGDEAELVLRGDANAVPDAETYLVRSAQRVTMSLPHAGYVIAYALTPAGLVAVGAVCVGLLLLPRSADRSRTAGSHRGGGSSGKRRRTRSGVVPATVTALALTATGVTGTEARFVDAATMRSGTFAGRTLDPPTDVRCVNQFLASDYITWTPPSAGPAPSGYRVSYSTNPAGPWSTEDVSPTPLRWRPPSATPYVTYYVYVADVQDLWRSAPNPVGDTITATSIIGINYFSC